MTAVFVGIGANMAEPQQQVQRAMMALAALPLTTLRQASACYRSRPMGPDDQPDYVNAVVELSTALSPLALLDHLQQIELAQGRVRKATRWGPRSLDLDILLYGAEIIAHERLTVPHYGMQEREFVLYPLAEIAPTLVLPCGTPLTELAARCPRNGLTVIADPADN